MTSNASSNPIRAWAKAILQPAQEFGPTPLPVISGTIPKGLRGSLYRNGAARLERGGEQVGHWFDGDGAILGVHFKETEAIGVYRYVQTEAYKAETKANRLLFEGYGTIPSGTLWERLSRPTKNAANTSVIALPNKLLAMWEGGQPHALDLQTLKTIGIDTLGGLNNNLPYGSHPKREPETGDIYNFGLSYGSSGKLHLYRSNETGRIQQQSTIALDGLPIIHDFVLAGQYLVFFIPPVRLNPLPVLAKLKSFSNSLVWRPELGTQILVIDRQTLSVVSYSQTEPWFQWLFSNGYVDSDGLIIVDLVRYEDFQTNLYFQEIVTGKTQTAAQGTLWRIKLNPHFAQIINIKQVLTRSCSFPTINPTQVGQPYRFTYLLSHSLGSDIGQEWFNGIACFDHHTGTFTEANLGYNRYPVEPIYAPDALNPELGWILTVVFDSESQISEIWIFNANSLHEPPVCRLALPSIVPLSFHGTWKIATI